MQKKITVLTNDYLKDPILQEMIKKEGFELQIDDNIFKIVNDIFNSPPDMFIIEKGLPNSLDVTTIQAIKNNLQFALIPIIFVVSPDDLKSYNTCPCLALPIDDFILNNTSNEEIIARIKLNFLRNNRISDTNPLTKLPGNTSILKLIQNNLDTKVDFAVLYLDIDNFKPFNDKYGFASGDEVIRMTARVLVNSVSNYYGDKGFVGHVGGDDFVCVFPNTKLEEVCKEIIKNFDSLITLFLSEEDIEANCFYSLDRQGNKQCFPLTSISLSVVPCPPGKFSHYGEVSAVAAQLKKYLKAQLGSNFMIDRRN